jgi:hypothetical protein
MIKTLDEFLNEGRVSWGGMQFQVNSLLDRNAMYLQFIPDGKTLDLTSTESLASRIKDRLDTKMPMVASVLEYDPDHSAAGLVFKLKPYDLADVVTAAIK